MNDDIRRKLEEWVKRNYNPDATGYTVERSMGNYDDVFNDGVAHGESWAAYAVGRILGMELEEPEELEEEW